MKKLLILLFILVYSSLGIYPCELETYKDLKTGKYGYIDLEGNIVIKPQFDYAWEFQFNDVPLALVRIGDKEGWIDKTGKYVIPLKSAYYSGFYEGLCHVTINDKDGYIDEKGNIVIPFIYNRESRNFHEGLACVKTNTGISYIDKTNKVIIQKNANWGGDFSEGLAWFNDKAGKTGFMDKTGKTVIPPAYTSAGEFKDGIAPVMIEEKIDYALHYREGYIDKSGNVVIPIQYDWIGEFTEGLAAARKNGKCGYLDKFGNCIIPFIFEDGLQFHEGCARVLVNEKYGFIDRTGTYVIPPKFDEAGPAFNHGIVEVILSGEQKYIDKSGKLYDTQIEARKAISKQNSSNVDVNIPINNTSAENTFAIIIANSEYKHASKIAAAKNDGEIMSKYLTQTLGIPAKHITKCLDATFGDMTDAIMHIQDVSKAFEGNINLIFYYVGHGLPDEESHRSFILPVDANPLHTRTCISLDELYQDLAKIKTKSTLVLLDACFSGANHGDGMLLNQSMGVAIKPKAASPIGNMIVFSATQENQTAYPYENTNHSLFTYWILKKLKESKGKLNLGELVDYVTENVQKVSVVENHKLQTPSISASNNIKEWRSISFGE